MAQDTLTANQHGRELLQAKVAASGKNQTGFCRKEGIGRTKFSALITGKPVSRQLFISIFLQLGILDWEQYVERDAEPSLPQNLPYKRSKTFIGRKEQLKKLHKQLRAAKPVVISAISGMGGIGKTELALQYGWEPEYNKTYPSGIAWIQARQEIGQQILDFAKTQFDLPIPDDLKLEAKVQWCWRHWPTGDCLLIFDDVQNYEDVEPWLNGLDPRFRVLLTTRLNLGPMFQKLNLKVLTLDESLKLLRTIVTAERINAELEVAHELCEFVEHLPLGLEMSAYYLARKEDCSLATLLERLKKKD